MDRFEGLNAFVRVVEAGSITGAAERLGVAKSAVSRRLAELEERLGTQLMRRTTRKLSLTDSGWAFYERAVRILSDLEEAETSVSQAQGALRGRLRVAAPLSFGLMHLGPAITEFAARHGEVTFDLDFNDREVDLLKEGFDLAVRIGELGDSSLIARRLAPVRLIPCASPAYLDANGAPRSPAELGAHRCLLYAYSREPRVWRYRTPAGEKGSVKVEARLQANNGDFLCQAAVAGEGVVLTPSFIAYREIELGRLVPVLQDVNWPEVAAYAVYPQTRHLSRRVRAFVDFLVERFAGVPYWDRALQTMGHNADSKVTSG